MDERAEEMVIYFFILVVLVGIVIPRLFNFSLLAWLLWLAGGIGFGGAA